MADKDIVGQLQQNLRDKIAEIKKILNALQTLKEFDSSIDVPEISSLFGADGETYAAGRDYRVRPDEFYGMGHTDAAEKFLRKIGHAVPLDSIYLALQTGGIKFTSNGKNALNVQLTRGTRKFVKLTHGDTVNFGLIEWYPKKRGTRSLLLDKEEETTEDNETVEEEKGKGPTDANQ